MMRAFLFVYISMFSVMAGLAHTETDPVRYSDRAEVRAFVDEIAEKHQFNRAELLGLLRGVQPQQKVLEAISRPAEKALSWAQYRPIFISESRIEAGARFWRKHERALRDAEREYGVPAALIVAVLGVETRYGDHAGKYPVFDSLVTLGFDAPRRNDFFRSELEAFLLLARDERIDPLVVKGSYAGAMGIPQFIASSYRAYAVDFDNDGRRDLFGSPADAIGSVANYFARHGWKAGRLVVAPARVEKPSGRIEELAVSRGRRGLKPELTVGEFKSIGVASETSLPEEAAVTLLKMDGEDGDEYWLGLNNFYVITRYNLSAMYALAVYQLSEKIEQHYQGLQTAEAEAES